MFRSILVSLDGTPQAAAALPLARAVARANDATLHLLQVTSSSRFETARATSYLQPIAAELYDDDAAVEFHVAHGDPAEEIVTFARAHRVDLIVMSTHAVQKRSILALASVARHVVTASPAPVLLLRPGGRRVTKVENILVPVDGSPGGALGLAAARAFSHATGSRLIVLEVVVPVPAEAVAALRGSTVGGYIDPVWEKLSATAARHYVDAVVASLVGAGVASEGHVALGQIGEEIEHCADAVSADLVVMSTHAMNWPERAYVESVADRVLTDGSRPVLFVRREAPGAEHQAAFGHERRVGAL
jgi:nucleotide-binding universal stress UspA family protein